MFSCKADGRKYNIEILFVITGGAVTGFGHIKRCLILAGYFRDSGYSSKFLVLGDDSALKAIEKAGYPGELIELGSLRSETFKNTLDKCLPITMAVTDICNGRVFNDQMSAPELLGEIASKCTKSVLIDSIGQTALTSQYPDLPLDVLVVPYVGSIIPVKNCQVIQGPEYAILDRAYSENLGRKIRPDADRVMVTCGGSDPGNLTEYILEALTTLPGRLTVRVIAGPLFSTGQVMRIGEFAKISRHQVEVIESPDSLVRHMLWSDICIATSGLVKYELATTGTPALLISIDPDHDVANEPFRVAETSLDLGILPSKEVIAGTTTRLLLDYELRKTFSIKGRKLVDGKGASKLVTALTE